MITFRTAACLVAVLLCVIAMAACDLDRTPLNTSGSLPGDAAVMTQRAFPSGSTPPPSGLVTVAFGSESLQFWPYTGENFSGQGQDPINLIFFGHADPRSIREALLSLDGDRTGFGWPNAPPFNGEWQDAIGNVQTGYSPNAGWTGGAIQLACGDYHGARFHLRLFRLGEWTVGNAHFEVLIPGTSDHQVLSWEFAEQFVTTDMMRTGLLDGGVPMMPSAAINPSPFRTIPSIIYNELPVDLRAAIGGPVGDVAADVPIATDGSAMIFNVATFQPWQTGTEIETDISQFDIVMPRPFCNQGPMDYVHVSGPVMLNQVNELTEQGEFISTFRAEGQLVVTPINPLTGEIIGESMRANVREHHDTYLSDASVRASSMQLQILRPPAFEGGGKLLVRLRVNTEGANGYQALIQCGDNPVEECSEAVDASLVSAKTR